MSSFKGNFSGLQRRPNKDDVHRTVIAWATLLALFLTSFSTLVGLSMLNGGMGVLLQGSKFVLRHGVVRTDVNQLVGAMMYTAMVATVLSAACAGILTMIVFFSYGTLKIETLLTSNDRLTMITRRLVRTAQAYAVVVVMSTFGYAILIRF